jgi:hypothetical protein
MKTTIGQKEFNFLLEKVKKLKDGERWVKLDDKVSLFFTYCAVRVGKILEELNVFPILDPETDNENVISLVFDATGLHSEFITEIEVFRSGETYVMYIIPERESREIDSFKKLLVDLASGEAEF